MAWLTIATTVAALAQKSRSATRSIAIPSLRVVENLLHLAKVGIANDVARVREGLLRKSDAEADAKAAEARKRLAEAVEAENRSHLSKRRAELEVRKETAAVEKLEAEARRETATARMEEAKATAIERALDETDEESIAEASERLKKALRRVSAKGGQVGVHVEDLTKLQKQLTEAVNKDDD